MARYGSPWSSGWGSPDNHFIYAVPDYAAAAASGNLYLPVAWRLRAGLDNAYVGVYRNANWLKNKLSNGDQRMLIDIPWGSNSMSVLPLRIGHLSDPSYSDEKVARVFESTENGRVTLQFTFVPKMFVPALSDNGGSTSNWTISGAVLGQNCSYVDGHPTWGRFGLTVATLGVPGTAPTVTLDMNGTPVAQGRANTGFPGNWTVPLAPLNNSGVSGQLTTTGANVTGGIVDLRWPQKVQILRDTFDPPTTVRDTVLFKGLNSVRWTESADLVAGTYYYRTQPISDTGQTGTQSASVSIATTVPPAPPTTLQYSSGNAAACILSFLNSKTAGATYRVYMATVCSATPSAVGVMSLNDIQATQIAGTPSAANTITLPAITGYPGFVPVILRAVSGGVEERNCNILFLEFDNSGNFVGLHPNIPVISTIGITSGRTIAIKGLYNSDHDPGPATQLQLFTRTPAGSYNYASPAASAALSAGSVPKVKTATINYTFGADGYYYVRLLAATAGGVQSQIAGANEYLILVSSDSLPATSGVTATLSRS